MIVVDTSAVIAILVSEPDRFAIRQIISNSSARCISAVNAHETATVLRGRYGQAAVASLWNFLQDSQIEIVPFDEAQVRAAADAFGRYGKGIHPKSRLNLADCAAYALAKSLGAPLLFKGGDFTHTDIEACV